MSGLEIFIIVFFVLVGIIILGLFARSLIDLYSPDRIRHTLIAIVVLVLGIATLGTLAWGVDMLFIKR